MDRPNTTEWLTLKEAGKRTGKSPDAVRSWIRRKTQSTDSVRIKKNGKKWLIHRDELLNISERDNEVRPLNISTEQATEFTTDNIPIPLEYYEKKRKEWESEKTELIRTYEQGLMMYRFKFEELDRKLKLLPAPVEVIAHEFEKVKVELDNKEQELSEVNNQLQKLISDRKQLENTLQTEQKTHDKLISEKETLSQQIEQTKAFEGVLQEQKAKLEEELEVIRRESQLSQQQSEQLSHQVEELTQDREKLGADKQEAEKKAAQLDQERKTLEEKFKEKENFLKTKEEENRKLQVELEEERVRPWWKKLLGIK